MTNNREPEWDEPDWDKLDPGNRVDDSQWDSIVASFDTDTAYNSEISADEVSDYLDENDDWEGPVVERIDWLSVPPARVVSVAAMLLGLSALIVGAVFVRPVPMWIVIAGIVSAVGGGLGALYTLPKDRREDDGDSGARV